MLLFIIIAYEALVSKLADAPVPKYFGNVRTAFHFFSILSNGGSDLFFRNIKDSRVKLAKD
jgi:hypothetical protein